MPSRMFKFIDYTLNPIVGCYHNCIYCWARMQAKRQKHRCMHCYYFIPHTHIERIYEDFTTGVFKRTAKGRTYFICSMSDLFGSWVSHHIIEIILDFIRFNKQSTFFIETKNPIRLKHFIDDIPENTIISTTIETNKYPYIFISKAPSPEQRYKAFKEINHPHKHVSIEPIIDFDLNTLVKWIKDIQPESVSIGYDNYGILKRFKVPEPSKEKVDKLISILKEFTCVEDKRKR